MRYLAVFFSFFLSALKLQQMEVTGLILAPVKKCLGQCLLYQQVIKHHSLNIESWVAIENSRSFTSQFLKSYKAWYILTKQTVRGLKCFHGSGRNLVLTLYVMRITTVDSFDPKYVTVDNWLTVFPCVTRLSCVNWKIKKD